METPKFVPKRVLDLSEIRKDDFLLYVAGARENSITAVVIPVSRGGVASSGIQVRIYRILNKGRNVNSSEGEVILAGGHELHYYLSKEVS